MVVNWKLFLIKLENFIETNTLNCKVFAILREAFCHLARRITAVLDDGRMTSITGPKVKEFEDKYAERCNPAR